MGSVIEMQDITKIYPEDNFMANHRVSFDLREGEILCLAGENGAGKTTLMKILYGLTPPTKGKITVKGKPVSISSPLHANRLGIGMVHQHFMLFPEFTVAENVVMGIEPLKKGFFFDTKKANERVAEVIRRHCFSIEPDRPVHSLTVGQMQQVEIVKMLYREVDIFILDEPTSVLTDQEIAALFDTLRALAASGKSLILITHKLNEIKLISHRVAVMRKGEMVGIRDTKDIDEFEISRLMVGKGVDLQVDRSRRKPAGNKPVITFDQVTVKRRGQERPKLNKISFTANAGEILGFAGVGGNGLGTLEAVLGGFLPITSGKIHYHDEDITRLHTAQLRRKGLAYVPADRLAFGCAAGASVLENMIINRRSEFFHRGFQDRGAISRFTANLFNRYAIAGNEELPIGSLSGGNIQKVILAREIDQYRDYIIFSEPTWGLDISASRYVYEQMAALREQGAAVLLLSSNLDEILANADRILVFYRGIIAAEIRDPVHGIDGAADADIKEKIGAYMMGLKNQHVREDVHG
ncbi:heme ABC transporter ATP-binding protein [Spirochaetia bacterium]|nr:heme ABC transporter ATP-binding protein [Spirochaetia bacterium]